MASQSSDPIGTVLVGLVSVPAKIVGTLCKAVCWVSNWGWSRTPWYGKLVLFIAAVALALHFVGALSEAVAG